MYLNKALVLSFFHPPKVMKIQISRGQASSREMFSKSCSSLPWGIAIGTKAHTVRAIKRCDTRTLQHCKKARDSKCYSDKNLHFSSLYQIKPGINLEKVQLGKYQRGFSQNSIDFSQSSCSLECPAAMWQTTANLALMKFLSTVEWKFWCSKAKPHKEKAQAPALCNLPVICSRGSAELPAQSLASMTHFQQQTSRCGDRHSRQVPWLQKWSALSHLI